ncbi:MAG: acetyltransferase [Aquabacterium sp.]
MNKTPILVLGCGGHARACIDVIEATGQYDIAGLLGQQAEVGTRVLGYEVVGTDADLSDWRQRVSHALVCVGQIKSPRVRQQLYLQLAQCGFSLPALVSPLAHVSRHARLGEGTIVMHGAIVNAGAHIGRNVIVNSRALIEHDVTVADHCHIATGAILNGDVMVGEGTFVGSGSVVCNGVRIGTGCVVGMGRMVFQHCPDHTTWPHGGA